MVDLSKIRRKYFWDPAGFWVDFIAILPFDTFYIAMSMYSSNPDVLNEWSFEKTKSFKVVRLIRIIRLVKVNDALICD